MPLPARWTRPPTASVALGAVYVVLAAATAALIFVRPPSDQLADFAVYWGAARAVLAGNSLYAFAAPNGDPFTYPPAALGVFLPLGHLPFAAAGAFWTLGSLVAIPVLSHVLARTWPTSTLRATSLTWLVAIGLLVSAPGQSNIRFGQISLFMVLLSAVDSAGAIPPRWRGVLVGMCAAVKLTPLLFVVYFVVTHQWRTARNALLAFCCTTGLAFLALPRDSVDFWAHRLTSTSRIGDLAALGNQSINGILLRSGLDPHLRPVVWLLLVMILALAGMVRAVHLERAGRHLAGTVLVGCVTLAVSPVSWVHHQFWTVLAAMLLIGAPRRMGRVAGWVLYALMTVSVVDIVARLNLGDHAVFLAANARGIAVSLLVVSGLMGSVLIEARRPIEPSRRASVGRPLWQRLVPLGVAAAIFLVTPVPLAQDSFAVPTVQETVSKTRGTTPLCAPGKPGPDCFEVPIFTPSMVNYGSGQDYTPQNVPSGRVTCSGYAGPNVRTLRYRSAPGGVWHDVRLVRLTDHNSVFAFTDADFTYSQLFAFDAGGHFLGDAGGKMRQG